MTKLNRKWDKTQDQNAAIYARLRHCQPTSSVCTSTASDLIRTFTTVSVLLIHKISPIFFLDHCVVLSHNVLPPIFAKVCTKNSNGESETSELSCVLVFTTIHTWTSLHLQCHILSVSPILVTGEHSSDFLSPISCLCLSATDTECISNSICSMLSRFTRIILSTFAYSGT